MIDSSVVFLDSGVGGLPYLQWLRERRPDVPMVYIADTANFPYGEMDDNALKTALLELVQLIFSKATPRILALVCNTASVVALDEIRAMAPCPVVGTVPAVKMAAGPSRNPIGVLATENTVNSPYLAQLVRSFVPEHHVVSAAAGDIVRYVEHQWLKDGEEGSAPIMSRALKDLRQANIKSLVIACTHFLHVLKPIRKYMGPGVELLDSRDGVGREILRLLGDEGHRSRAEGGFFVSDLLNNQNNQRYQDFARVFNLDWLGQL